MSLIVLSVSACAYGSLISRTMMMMSLGLPNSQYIWFHLVLKYLKLVFHDTLFGGCSRYGSNWWHFTCETCEGSIYRLIVPPNSLVSSDSIVSFFFFTGCIGIGVWITLGWAFICGEHSILIWQTFQDFRFIYLLSFFISLVVRFSIFVLYIFQPFFTGTLVQCNNLHCLPNSNFLMGALVMCNDLHCLKTFLRAMTIPFLLSF